MSEHEEALQAISEQAGRLLSEAVTPSRLKALLDAEPGFDRDLWRQTVDLGWTAVAMPEDAGGLGLGWDGLCRLTESLGTLTASLPLVGNAVTADALLASAAKADGVAGALVAGERVAAVAFLEPGEMGLPEIPQATWRNGRLSGRKSLTAFGAVADVALVTANCDGRLALLCVDLNQEGVARSVLPTIDNARAGAELTFANAAATRLDGGHDGHDRMLRAAAIGAIATAFEQVGGARACLDMACDYARERKVFAQPIGRFQAIKHALADIYSDVEVARGCALDALTQLERGSASTLAYAAAARLAAIQAYEHAASGNIQVHGGIGVTWDAAPHHHYRRSRALALEWGSAPYWREQLVDRVEMLAEGY